VQERGPRFLVVSGARYLPIDIKRLPILHRRLSLSLENVTVAEALAAISAQSGLPIAYSEDLVSVRGRVRLHAADIPVAAALTAALLEASVDVVFTPDGRAGLVRRVPSEADLRPVGTISGVVTDIDTEAPLSGASIIITETKAGATTDVEGRYRIANVAPGSYHVTVRRVGYAPLSRLIVVAGESTVSADFALSRVASVLDQLVVWATGEGRAKEEGNARTIITSESFKNVPAADPQQVLTGQVPGLTLLSNSGQPGAGGTILLRGINSISTDNSPIIYIDGVRMFNDLGLTSFTGRQGYLPMNDIGANDIDRIEVVKGAAATTLYGTQASGGVIQIFTKRGQPGRSQWALATATGFHSMGTVAPDNNPTGLFMNRCRGADVVDVFGTPIVDPTCPEGGSWFEKGWISRIDLAVGGGTSGGTTYYVAGNYSDENGVIQGAGHTQGGIRANFSFAPSKKWALTFNSSYTRRFTTWVPDGDNGNALFQNVALGAFGRFGGGTAGQCAGVSAPSVCVLNDRALMVDSHTAADHFTTSLTATIQQSSAIDHRITAGYDYNVIASEDRVPFGFPTIPLGSLSDVGRSRARLSLEYAGTWRAKLGSRLTSALSVGAQAFREDGGFRWLTASNFAGPVDDPTLTSGGIFSVTRDSSASVINGGLFVQDVIGFEDRLFVTGGLRIDGSTAFGENYGLQPYPKIGVSYVLSNSSWWPKWWPTMRVRGAYGESGKAPRSFDKLATWTGVPADSGISGLIPGSVGDANLGPERTGELEGGIDAGWLDDRIMLEVTTFRARTTDALVPVSPVPSLGFISSQLRNVGTIEAKGTEIHVTADVLRMSWLEWSIRGNLSFIDTKAIDVGGGRIFAFQSGIEAGMAVPTYFGSKVTNPDAIADPIIATNQPIGRAYPNRLLGLGTTLQLGRRVTVEAQGDGQFGGYLISSTAQLSALRGVWPACYPVQRKLIAFGNGDQSALTDVTALQRAQCSLSPSVSNIGFWTLPSDFFRLRTVSVTYRLPFRWARDAAITVAGRNLGLWTKFKGVDPEVQDLADPWGSRGLGRREYYNLPPSRTFLVSVRVAY
jgi:hypothetical protein